jgi:hypothetical protein
MKTVKAPKYVEEKKMNAEKKKARSQQRDKKTVAWEETIIVEEPPQMETPKELEETFAHYKRTCDPKDPLYQRRPGLVDKVKESLSELVIEDIHKESEEGWESDGDDWFE